MRFLFLVVPFFTLVNANAESYGVMMVVKPPVKILSVKGNTFAAKVGEKVFPGDEVQSGAGAGCKIVMTDRNVLILGADSKIKISKYENDGKNKNVEIKLTEGQLRSSVEQKYEGQSHYEVVTPVAVAGVRGTDFVTEFNVKTQQSSVTTVRGEVAFAPQVDGQRMGQHEVRVAAGQFSRVQQGQMPSAARALPPMQMQNMMKNFEGLQAPGDSKDSKEKPNAERPATEGGKENQNSERPAGEGGKEKQKSERSASEDGKEKKNSERAGGEKENRDSERAGQEPGKNNERLGPAGDKQTDGKGEGPQGEPRRMSGPGSKAGQIEAPDSGSVKSPGSGPTGGANGNSGGGSHGGTLPSGGGGPGGSSSGGHPKSGGPTGAPGTVGGMPPPPPPGGGPPPPPPQAPPSSGGYYPGH